eukprot:COSAG01_NODE_8904_length_2621_cov_1.521412_2_plen_102_part_00
MTEAALLLGSLCADDRSPPGFRLIGALVSGWVRGGARLADPRSPGAALPRQVLSEAGPRGLFAGLGPRLAKVSPACAIMIGSYELGKAFFTHQNNTTKKTR